MAERTAKRPRRSNGEGSIYETKDGRLRGAVIVTDPSTGVERRRFVSGRTRAEVVRRMDLVRQEASAGTRELTGAYLARWLRAVMPQLRPATVHGYRVHVESHLTPLAAIPLAKLTPSHVEGLMADMIQRRGLSPQTARHVRATLRRALHDAERDGLLSRNVAALARPPRLERRELHSLTPMQVRQLLDSTADHAYGPLYALAVASGLRLGELLGLRWRDVDLSARLLVVRNAMAIRADRTYGLAEPKTSRSRRTVMLSALAIDSLQKQLVRQTAARDTMASAWQNREEFVFTDPVGRPLTPSAPSAAFHKSVAALGFAVRFHDLRHTAATLLLGAGVPLKVVSETLGHSSIAITADVYAHVTPELRREAADAMDRALS